MAFSSSDLNISLYFDLTNTQFRVKDNSPYVAATPSIPLTDVVGVYKCTDPNSNILHENIDFNSPDIDLNVSLYSPYITFTVADGVYTVVYSVYDSNTATTYSKTFTFTYAASNTPTVVIDVESDVGLATISSTDETAFTAAKILNTRTHTLTYPASWGSTVSTSITVDSISLTDLYTGEYTSTITSTLTITQTDNLIIDATITGTETHDVWDTDGFYTVREALNSYYDSWQVNKTSNPSEGRNQEYVWTEICANYTMYNSYKQNGDIENAGEYLDNIKTLLAAEDIDTDVDPSTSVPVSSVIPGYASQWLNGSGAPASNLGRTVDYYTDTDSNYYYSKETGSWVQIGDLGVNSSSISVKFFGAIGDGVTDDTTAIQDAFDYGTDVYFPEGTYICDTVTVTNEGTHVRGNGTSSTVEFKSGETGIMINAGTKKVTIENIRFYGGAAANYTSVSSSPADRTGLSVSSSKNSFISGITIDGFENIGLLINDVGTASLFDRIRVVNSVIKENWKGIDTGLDGENYTIYSGLIIRYCRYAFYAGQGNVSLTNSNIYKNYYGIYLDGTRLNDGHGIASNLLINHNTHPIYATAVENGYTFVGNQIFEGTISLIACTGISITSGTIDVDEFVLTNGGINIISDNHSRTNWSNTISHTTDNTTFINNYLDDGTYLEGRTAPGIYTKHAVAGTRTGFGVEVPIFNLEAQSEGFSTASYVVRNSLDKLINYAYEESAGNGGHRILDKDGNIKIKFDSGGDSYFNGGGLAIGTDTVNASAALHVTSTTGAILFPRLTTTEKNALTPVNGMILYDSTLNKFQGYENGAWVSLI